MHGYVCVISRTEVRASQLVTQELSISFQELHYLDTCMAYMEHAYGPSGSAGTNNLTSL